MTEWKKKRDIMRRYDATACIYDVRYEQEQRAKYVAAFESLQKQKLGLVLDVGCGTGLLFSRIKDASSKIVGVDISRRTLLKAKQRARNLANTEVIQADADFIPLRVGTFDHVFAITLVQNSPNPAQTLKEIKRVSKDEAVIIITGLKKIFSKRDFRSLLRKSEVHTESLKDEASLKCYIARCTKIHH
jgi:ubiquinone/menaquinone biosynthesis C-methylase UbiE